MNPVFLEIGIGLALLSNIPAIFTKKKQAEKPASHTALLIIGFLAGFVSGITGAVGLLFNRFYLRYGLTKEAIIATRAANEILLHLIKIILYILFGLITREVIAIGCVIAAAAFLSTWVTKYVLPKISEVVFRKIGYTAMVISGCMMLAHSNLTMEYSYGDGFEFEQVIPMSELTAQQQQVVKTRRDDADTIVIEIVHAIGERSYEAYYYSNKKLIEKFNFD